MARKISYSEVRKHGDKDSCWVVLYGKVYDMTSYLNSHPGGPASILRLAGKDATEEFDPIHPPGTLESNLPSSALVGIVDPSSPLPLAEPQSQDPSQNAPQDIAACLNLADIEALATSKISPRAWAYYFSASDDLVTKSFNNAVYNQILLRPRIFVDITRCTLQTSLLHSTLPASLPIFISPAAQARLCHPDGEAGIARACARFGALQLISNNASLTAEQIVAASPETTYGFQLYVQQDRRKSEALLARLRRIPQIKLLVLTLDAPVGGKREHDERRNVTTTAASATTNLDDDPATRAEKASGGVGKALFAGTATDLTWATTLPWLAQHCDLPLVLKGIQTHEDALIASRYPQVKAIILSNHGGRALDTAPPPVHTLLEIRRHCPQVMDRVELWVDGGIKRGTDVVKALCLGAKAVGIGRAPLWGLGAAGTEGVEKVFEILKAETKTCLRLLGVGRVDQLGLWHINTSRVEREIYRGSSAPDAVSNPPAKL